MQRYQAGHCLVYPNVSLESAIMEMWAIIQIASLLLIVLLLVFIWRADSKLNRLEAKLNEKNNH